MKFEDFISAQKYAEEKKKETGPRLSATPPKEKGNVTLSPEEVDFFINLQTKTWGKEAADYHKYAQAMWREFFNENPDESPNFKDFESTLIGGLHEINTREHVYPQITRGLGRLIEQHGDSVKKVILWSTGDVSSTGFQISKIKRSGVIMDFYKTLKEKFSKEKAKEFMREKTEYMVDDDKFVRFVEYAKVLLAENPGERIKLVVIEDTATNFGKIQSLLNKALDARSLKRIKITPVWAAYSRYGKRGQEMARVQGREKNFEEKKKFLNAINSFGELNRRKKFGKIFKDAHVFIDFDGVISNDDTRRVEQTEIVFRALNDAAEKRGIGMEQLRREVLGQTK